MVIHLDLLVANCERTRAALPPGFFTLLLDLVEGGYHSGATAGSVALSVVTFTEGMNLMTRSEELPVKTS